MTDVRLWARTVARGRVPLLVGVAVLIVGIVAGYLVGSIGERWATRDRHAATAEALTGRVIVSNTGGRWIIFYPDGVVDPDKVE